MKYKYVYLLQRNNLHKNDELYCFLAFFIFRIEKQFCEVYQWVFETYCKKKSFACIFNFLLKMSIKIRFGSLCKDWKIKTSLKKYSFNFICVFKSYASFLQIFSAFKIVDENCFHFSLYWTKTFKIAYAFKYYTDV